MKLLLDIGHTRIKAASLVGEKITAITAFNYQPESFTELMQEKLDNINVQTVTVSNVAGNEVQLLCDQWCDQAFQFKPRYLNSQRSFQSLQNGYQQPETLGVDRWLALIGAYKQFNTPFCVIDCGSFLTVDAVNVAGQHLGGHIIPGHTVLDSVFQEKTQGRLQMPDRSLVALTDFWGTDTATGIQRGSTALYLAYIQLIKEKLHQRFGDCDLIFTGGGAPAILKQLSDDSVHHRANLVFEGMAAL